MRRNNNNQNGSMVHEGASEPPLPLKRTLTAVPDV